MRTSILDKSARFVSRIPYPAIILHSWANWYCLWSFVLLLRKQLKKLSYHCNCKKKKKKKWDGFPPGERFHRSNILREKFCPNKICQHHAFWVIIEWCVVLTPDYSPALQPPTILPLHSMVALLSTSTSMLLRCVAEK